MAHAERKFGVVNVDGLRPAARSHEAPLNRAGPRDIPLNVFAVVILRCDLLRRVRGSDLTKGGDRAKDQRRDGAAKQ
jgi:hypothetical protein